MRIICSRPSCPCFSSSGLASAFSAAAASALSQSARHKGTIPNSRKRVPNCFIASRDTGPVAVSAAGPIMDMDQGADDRTGRIRDQVDPGLVLGLALIVDERQVFFCIRIRVRTWAFGNAFNKTVQIGLGVGVILRL